MANPKGLPHPELSLTLPATRSLHPAVTGAPPWQRNRTGTTESHTTHPTVHLPKTKTNLAVAVANTRNTAPTKMEAGFHAKKKNKYDLCHFYEVGISRHLPGFPTRCEPKIPSYAYGFAFRPSGLGQRASRRHIHSDSMVRPGVPKHIGLIEISSLGNHMGKAA